MTDISFRMAASADQMYSLVHGFTLGCIGHLGLGAKMEFTEL